MNALLPKFQTWREGIKPVSIWDTGVLWISRLPKLNHEEHEEKNEIHDAGYKILGDEKFEIQITKYETNPNLILTAKTQRTQRKNTNA
jgi:hypothetical protein